MDTAAETILRNAAHFEGARDPRGFGHALHEERRWDWDLWWPLDRALLELHAEYPAPDPLPRDLARALFRLHRLCLGTLAHHLDPGDMARIEGLAEEDARALMRRCDWVFDAAFTGRPRDPVCDDYANPLMVPSATRD